MDTNSGQNSQLGAGLIILGINRSGTSATAAALAELGLFLGDEAHLQKGRELDYDCLEAGPIVDLNRRLIGEFALGGSPGFFTPSNWRDFANMDIRVENAAEFIASYYAKQPFWGWKEPLTTLLLPVYHEVFRHLGTQPKFVLTVRNPLDVAQGLHHRQGTPVQRALGGWAHYMLTALHDVPTDRMWFVGYRDLVADPAAALKSLVEALSIPAPTAEQWESVRGKVKSELNRRTNDDASVAAVQPEIIDRIYGLLKEILNNQEQYRAGGYRDRVDALWDEWQSLATAMRFSLNHVFVVSWVFAAQPPGDFRTVIHGERKWIPISVTVPAGRKGDCVFSFEPHLGRYHLRNMVFVDQDGETRPAVPSARSGAFVETFQDLAQVQSFARTEHCMFKAPDDGGPWELRFEVQAEYSQRSVSEVTDRLGQEVMALRRQATAPKRW